MVQQIHELPWYVSVTLWASVVIALLFFFLSTPNKKMALASLGVWVLLVVGISLAPISLPLWALPACIILFIGISLLLPVLKAFLFSLEVEFLHHLHLWRLPSAFVFLWTYQAGYIELSSTFEGLNYDIVIGLTAPVIASLAFSQKMLNREILIGWNFLGLIAWVIALVLVGNDVLQKPPMTDLFTQLPYTFFLGVLMPMSLLSHMLSLVHLFKGDIEVES